MAEQRFSAVFISDLHLHPQDNAIQARFHAMIKWAATHTQSLYILGDFFHVWPGDDGRTAWSDAIAARLQWLSKQGISIFFMHGNRDFLLGERFANAAGMTILPEPTILNLGKERVLLSHGDRYCTLDKSHQRFRKLTRTRWFPKLFLRFPLKWRLRVVAKVRAHSQSNRSKTAMQMDVVAQSMLEHMEQKDVIMIIHGHTHKPGLSLHCYNKNKYQQYVLSDWDDKPQALCYDESKGLEFIHIDF